MNCGTPDWEIVDWGFVEGSASFGAEAEKAPFSKAARIGALATKGAVGNAAASEPALGLVAGWISDLVVSLAADLATEFAELEPEVELPAQFGAAARPDLESDFTAGADSF